MTSTGTSRDSKPDVQATGRRFGQLAKVRPKKIDEYKRLHAQIWPEVARGLTENHIHNYSIWLKELGPGEHYLFGYFEYTGNDFDGDMARMNEDPVVCKWEQAAGDECLVKISPQDENWWVDLEEIFHDAAAAARTSNTTHAQRVCRVIGLRPELVDAYKYLHQHAWPEVRAALRRSNLRNDSCYLARLGKEFYVFRYFEYIGDDFDTDMATANADPAVMAWVRLTDEACHQPILNHNSGQQWALMENVFCQSGSTNGQ